MCFELDSSPPITPIAGAAVDHEDLVLDDRFAAFGAIPEEPGPAGVVVLPDVRGLYRFYEELALRFAERGIAAIAIDYFGRTAGIGKRDDDFPFMDHVVQCSEEGVQEDIAGFFGAATLQRFRGAGAHSALLDARVALALEAGARWATAGALPGSQSQHNMERRGFRVAYTRPVMVRALSRAL